MSSRGPTTLAVIACLSAWTVLSAQTTGRPGAKPTPPPARPARVERTVPFTVGETLSYDVGWSSMTAGTATVRVREKRPSFGSTAYYIVADGRPTPWLAALYSVYYKADTLLDAYSLLPQRASLYSEEGRHRRMAATRFDQVRRTARYEVTTATVVRRDLVIPAESLDTLSAIYVIRTLPLREGFTLTLPVVDGDDVFRVRVTVIGRERITTPAGEFPAWRITPLVLDEKDRTKGRGLVLWISDDARRVPVQLEADMPVGRFVLSLRQMTG